MRSACLRSMLASAVIASTLVIPSGARAAEPVFTYAAMSDGVKIALAVSYPAPLTDPTETTHAWPALLMIDGYEGAAGALNTNSYGRNKYVVIHASLRGTGCSGGRFGLFDRRGALDGNEIIDRWIPAQPWSNGRVGIVGHSYPGLSGFLVASTGPKHLYATAISGLIDDLYRGMVYPGGVPNMGFPVVWTAGSRPAIEVTGNAPRYADETSGGDPTCAENIAARPPRDVLDDPMLNGVVLQDSQWFASHALMAHIKGIDKPIDITQQWQDEQSGARGGNVLWENIPPGVPKRLQLTNGVHGTTSIARSDRNDWLDCFVIVKADDPNAECGTDRWGYRVDDSAARVQVHFETQSGVVNAPLVGADWPLPQTEWMRYYLRSNGTLTGTPGSHHEASTQYVSLPEGRQTAAYEGGLNPAGGAAGQVTYVAAPDEASYTLDFGAPTAIAGPIQLTLSATSTAPDTDFFVDVIDRDTSTGEMQYLQRGLQRASHRLVDELHSDYVKYGPMKGTMYRPYEPHSAIAPIVPNEAVTYEIEVFPVAHVFRAGHVLVVKVHAPPPADPLSIYAWVSAQPPAVNTIIHAMGASSILLPVLPSLPPLGAPPACGAQIGIPCFKPVV